MPRCPTIQAPPRNRDIYFHFRPNGEAMPSGFRQVSAILQTCLAFFSPWYLGARQQQEKPIPNSAPVIRSSVNEVLVPVVVRNAQGHAVGTLKKDDFQLFDDGKQQVITGFTVVKRISETPGAAPPIPTPDAAAVAPNLPPRPNELSFSFSTT
jgi:hypothetical protein